MADEEHKRRRNVKIGDVPGLPGAWIDANGDYHIAVPEVLAALGLPSSPAHRAEAIKIIEKTLKEMGVTTKVRLKPDPLPEN
jgi:hypothetical protein